MLNIISINPKLYSKSQNNKAHQAAINKRIILLYRLKQNMVELLTFLMPDKTLARNLNSKKPNAILMKMAFGFYCVECN